MESIPQGPTISGQPRIPVRIKLSALWTSAMFCYVYGDYFLLYRQGKLQRMLAGEMAPFGQVTQGVLLGVSISMVIPCLMISSPWC